ncbi:hypothetical protein BDV37DRAFT_216363 [Aspergillus pseudonomiae]|uniref:Uncharacterized protein n=1 Tax=Aspergillus pseudonomiae TaxID=1506151 RepID=A0A5N7D0K6_9EURO|nr:uncharacterized protein BDV37DRAFT_216363 [Aspergillus pseudonomiae]KAE8399962.1 hypothetical protein BDV37DRAFT_216363 [Aspergillus pseudonomiae]
MHSRQPNHERQVFTSNHGGHRAHIHPVGDFEGVRRAFVAYRDPHTEEAAAAGGHHRGLHRVDVEVDNHQYGDGEASGVHSHHGHNNPGALELVTAPGNEHGDCSPEVEGISGRTHLRVDSSGEGTETGKDHGRGARQQAGSKGFQNEDLIPAP